MADNLFAGRFQDGPNGTAAEKEARWNARIAENKRKIEAARGAAPRGTPMPEIMRMALRDPNADPALRTPTSAQRLTAALGVKVKPGAVRWGRAHVRDSQKRSDLFKKAARILQSSGAAAEFQVITPAFLKKIVEHDRVTGSGAAKLREYQAKLVDEHGNKLRGGARVAKMESLRDEKLAAMDGEQRAKYEAATARRKRRAEGMKPVTKAFNATHSVARAHMRASTKNRNAHIGAYHIGKHVREQAEKGITWAPYNAQVAKDAENAKKARSAARAAARM